jgi:hypothetical protein
MEVASLEKAEAPAAAAAAAQLAARSATEQPVLLVVF